VPAKRKAKKTCSAMIVCCCKERGNGAKTGLLAGETPKQLVGTREQSKRTRLRNFIQIIKGLGDPRRNLCCIKPQVLPHCLRTPRGRVGLPLNRPQPTKRGPAQENELGYQQQYHENVLGTAAAIGAVRRCCCCRRRRRRHAAVLAPEQRGAVVGRQGWELALVDGEKEEYDGRDEECREREEEGVEDWRADAAHGWVWGSCDLECWHCGALWIW
jgi:hypothetical protein